jgi:hypothetical protein
MEEVFFFQYHMRMSRSECMGIPIYERKWLIDRFIDQKNKENQAMEEQRRKSKTRH